METNNHLSCPSPASSLCFTSVLLASRGQLAFASSSMVSLPPYLEKGKKRPIQNEISSIPCSPQPFLITYPAFPRSFLTCRENVPASFCPALVSPGRFCPSVQDPTPSYPSYFISSHSFPMYYTHGSQHRLPLPNTVPSLSFSFHSSTLVPITVPISSLRFLSAHCNLAFAPKQIAAASFSKAPSSPSTALNPRLCLCFLFVEMTQIAPLF